MTKILYTRDFIKSLQKLPQDIQRLYLIQEDLLRKNWQDPRLHTKKLKGKLNNFSFRITRSYRALFYFRSSNEITLFAIGDRKNIYD